MQDHMDSLSSCVDEKHVSFQRGRTCRHHDWTNRKSEKAVESLYGVTRSSCFCCSQHIWCAYFWISDVGFQNMSNTPWFTLVCTVKRSQLSAICIQASIFALQTNPGGDCVLISVSFTYNPLTHPFTSMIKSVSRKKVMMMTWPKYLAWFQDGREHT